MCHLLGSYRVVLQRECECRTEKRYYASERHQFADRLLVKQFEVWRIQSDSRTDFWCISARNEGKCTAKRVTDHKHRHVLCEFLLHFLSVRDQIVLHNLLRLEHSASSFAVSEASLIYADKVVAVLGERLSYPAMSAHVVTVPMDPVHHTATLAYRWPSVIHQLHRGTFVLVVG